MIRISELKLPLGREENILPKKAAGVLGIPEGKIKHWRIFKKSLDARKKESIHYTYILDVQVENEKRILQSNKNRQVSRTPDLQYRFPEGKCTMAQRPIVVGFGPGGMFAGLLLAQMGLSPIILERGGHMDSRKEAVEKFWTDGKLDLDNNVQFGEGGAGTFSDGKLTTRIKDKRCRKVLEEFVEAGAPADILYDSKPHIGTDLLCGIVKKIREKIISLGGEVRFFSKVTDVILEDGKVTAVEVNGTEKIETTDLILALGHSARDTLQMLYEKGIPMEQKPFAMGVRIEHPQDMINKAQYGEMAHRLPAADYHLTYTTKKQRGVYTFCMCPGGYVVAAASEEGRLAVNGMSQHKRNGKNANSALLVQVFPEDFPSDSVLSGMEFQRQLEEKAFLAGGGGYGAPIQTVGDFLQQTGNTLGEVEPSHRPKVAFANMDDIFPSFMTEAMREAIPAMGKRLKGFDRKDAILTAVESRSSSPVRILRNGKGQSLLAEGLYPAGEGAGYAGGIVSAAVDGIAAAEYVFQRNCEKISDGN